jgi:short-subunit dehydrogenase
MAEVLAPGDYRLARDSRFGGPAVDLQRRRLHWRMPVTGLPRPGRGLTDRRPDDPWSAPVNARKTALITGASSGIGEAFAKVFASNGFDLVLTARREDRLQALAAALAAQEGIAARVVAADLAQPDACARIEEAVASAGIQVDALVNNAGFAVPGRYAATRWNEQAVLLKVLVTSVAELAHRFLPGMMARQYGRIVNVASLAGLLPGLPGSTLYTGAKAFVVRFSQSLANETRHQGIHVTAVCPGYTHSEFHDVMGVRAKVSRLPRLLWMDADTVARQGYDAVMSGRIVCVTGRVNRGIAGLARIVPESLVLRALAPRVPRER